MKKTQIFLGIFFSTDSPMAIICIVLEERGMNCERGERGRVSGWLRLYDLRWVGVEFSMFWPFG